MPKKTKRVQFQAGVTLPLLLLGIFGFSLNCFQVWLYLGERYPLWVGIVLSLCIGTLIALTLARLSTLVWRKTEVTSQGIIETIGCRSYRTITWKRIKAVRWASVLSFTSLLNRSLVRLKKGVLYVSVCTENSRELASAFRKAGLAFPRLDSSDYREAYALMKALSVSSAFAIFAFLYGFHYFNAGDQLVIAAVRDHRQAAWLSLAAGFDPNSKASIGAQGLSGLSAAALLNRTDIAKIYIDGGANPNAARAKGMTPLLDASCRGHSEMVELLIREGADVNLRGTWGATPLICAAANGHEQLVEFLLAKGADPGIKMHDGKTTAFKLAKRFHYDTIAGLLVSRRVPARETP